MDKRQKKEKQILESKIRDFTFFLQLSHSTEQERSFIPPNLQKLFSTAYNHKNRARGTPYTQLISSTINIGVFTLNMIDPRHADPLLLPIIKEKAVVTVKTLVSVEANGLVL